MEKVYEELDDAKAEIEKLRLECRAKADLCDNLKRSHADQVKRIQELNQKLEKQAQEVEAKADEVFDTKQSLEELGCRLKEKESVVKSLISTNDKLRADFDSKLRESEEEKQKLLSSLEEANVKMLDLEHKNRAFMDEIEVLKEGIVSVSQKKCVSESKMAMASKQMRERGDMFGKLEEEKVKLEEQLKWKNEQFQHLEEAHKKLRDNLKEKEKEWNMEKCTFVDHISAMETKLGSQSKVSEVFRRRLETCSEALACEENRRKGLDIQILELEEMKSRLVMLTNEKESACKEMESQISKLGEENQELVSSLKESQIREANNSSSITKLQNNIKSLEQNHNVKEAEWSSQFEKLAADLNSCKLELTSKEARLKDIMIELNDYNSQVLQLRMEIKSWEQNHNEKEAEWSSQFEKVAADLNTCRLELASKESRLKDIMTESNAYNSQVLQLRTEIKSLEQIYNAREAEWSSQLEKLIEDLISCRFELESKDARLKEIMTESDDYNSQVLQLTMEIKSLEQIHKAREAEWNSQFDKVVEDLNSCRPELESKEARLKEIMAELDDSNSQVLQLTKEKQESACMMEAVKSKVAADLNSFRLELESKDARLKEIMMELNDCNSQVLQLTKEKEESALMMKAMKSAADADLDSCRLELQSKEAHLKEITRELNDYNSQVLQLTKEKEESAVMMVAMKSTLLEARSNIDKEKLLLHKEIESHKKKLLQTESELVYVCDLLESKEASLKEITTELNDCNSQVLQLIMEKEESAIMMVAMKSTLMEAGSNIDEDKLSLHKELDSHKKQLLQTTSELENACDLLDKANEELAHSYCEVNGVEFELQIWKSVAEKLEVHLEASRQMRRDVEASLLAQVATEVNLKEENSSLACTLKEKEKTINDLEEKIKEVKQNKRLQLAKKNGDDLEKWEKDWVTQELEAAILAQLEYERIHEYEKQSLNQLVEEKDQRIINLQEIMSSLEKELDHSSASFSSQLTKMQAEMNLFHDAWQKIRTNMVLKEIEVQEKSLMIIELEKDLGKQVEFVKKCLLSVKNLSSENENLMDIIGGASEWIDKLSREDGQVMGTLRNIMLSFDENRVRRGVHGRPDLEDHFDPLKENINLHQSPKRNGVDVSLDERSPLRTLNS